MTATDPAAASAGLAGRLRGNRLLLSRTLTRVETGRDAAGILKAIQPALGNAYVVGVTGPPGSGKSTLINVLIGEFRTRGHSVAVVAVDPSSPLSGGSILGDRARMGEHAGDDGVFIRSAAAGGQSGGLALNTSRLIDVFDAAGYDIVMVETVGAGQAEVEIADLAHTTVVLCAPGLGDDLQAIKAGILEIADILVVNKGDSPLAAATAKQLHGALGLRRDRRAVPVLITTATTKTGVEKLADTLFHQRNILTPETVEPAARIRRLLVHRLGHALEHRLRGQRSGAIDALCLSIQRGEMEIDAAVDKIIDDLPGYLL